MPWAREDVGKRLWVLDITFVVLTLKESGYSKYSSYTCLLMAKVMFSSEQNNLDKTDQRTEKKGTVT